MMETRDILRDEIDIYDELSEKEQEILAVSSICRKYTKHQMLKTSESGCSGLLFVKQGEIRVYLLSDEGRDVTLYRLHEGDICIFSSMCVLNQINFDVFIESMGDTEILQIGAAAVAQVSRENLKFENYLLNLTLDKFNEVMWTMQQILFKSMDVRLAEFLLDEASGRGTDNFKITHEEIARYLGSAREVISRTLKYFQNEHLVKLHRGGIEILDRTGLRQIAHK